MKYFSAQYIMTNAGPPLKRAVVCAKDDGTIISVEKTEGNLSENHSVEFYNGVIVPGFVNCHCHLELSHLKNEIPEKTGLSSFLMSVTSMRSKVQKDIDMAIRNADSTMAGEGIVLCADICNTTSTFSIKKSSPIKYINLLEVFGIDPEKAEVRMNEILSLSQQSTDENIPNWIVPHSVYSISLPLFRLIKKNTLQNRISSLHFMESEDEKIFLAGHSGPLMDSYQRFLPPFAKLSTARDHVSAVMEEMSQNGNLILVHNTFIEKENIANLKKRKNIFYCLCPNSNQYIEGRPAPAGLLSDEGCEIVVGTDSLSSNHKLSMLEELKTLQLTFPHSSLETLVKWATINGARALEEENWAGSIETGKKPGLVLIRNLDLSNLKLLPESRAQRIL
jgi:aminodeoxyfutalosine deaminase